MTKGEMREGYWRFAEQSIRESVPEVFGKATIHYERDAFDGRKSDGLLQLTCIATVSRPVKISVGIYIKSSDAKRNERVFEFLCRRSEEIRSILPYKHVEIGPADGKGRQPDGGRLQYNLLVNADLDVMDESNWDCCRFFHSEVAKAIYAHVVVGLGPTIRAL